MTRIQSITPCLWFDDQAEEAVRFYTEIFEDSTIRSISRYGEEGAAIHGRPAGSVMAVSFELNGQPFTALNGGPMFTFSEAVSFQIECETQDDIDYFWDKLTEGGDPEAQQCGWLKDRFGLSWQVFPRRLPELLNDSDRDKAGRVMNAMLSMKKIDLDGLKKAAGE